MPARKVDAKSFTSCQLSERINCPASPAEQQGPFTPGQELLLGVGSTAGIAVQLLILVPYLRAAGIRYRPRLDLRGSGLGHTLRLGLWTVLFVILPLGVTSHHEAGIDLGDGGDPGAPVDPKLKKKFITTTWVSVIVFLLIFGVVHFKLVDLTALPWRSS